MPSERLGPQNHPEQPRIDRFWDLRASEVDPQLFFRLLPHHFPEATLLFFEGTTFSPAVLRVLRKYTEPGPFLPGANTIWPTSKKIRCRFSPGLTGRMAYLAARHAIPELCDHLFVYAGDNYLIYWHDAFDNSAYLAPELAPDRVAQFAATLGCAFQLVEPPL